MSRFFNESRKARQSASHVSDRPNVDLHQAVSNLKERMGAQSKGASHAGELTFRHAAIPLEDPNEIAAQVAEVRLEKCRRMRLPRTEEKSFLVAQYNDSMQAAVEAYRTLRTRLVKQQTRQGTRSLVITSAAQGEGKTLTALNLALCYSKIENCPVLLIDADLRTKGLSLLLGHPPAPGLGELLEDGSSYESAVLRTDVPNLYFLPAGDSSAPPPELFSGANWKELIGWCSESFRMVIIDSPPVLNLADFELIAAPCESTLLIVRARKSQRDSLAKILAQVEPGKLAGVVFNSTEETQNGYYRYAGTADRKAGG